MTAWQNLPLIISYPPGSGGSFIGSALNSVLLNRNFNISPNGSCHNNSIVNMPDFVSGNSVACLKNELELIENFKWPTDRAFVARGHFRNLIAIQEVCNDAWFVKIVVDPTNDAELTFLFNMLMAKMPIIAGLKNCYSAVRHWAWPDTLEEFLAWPDHLEEFKQQHIFCLKNWWWAENQTTRQRTIELTVQDVFLGVPGEKLSQWFSDKTVLDSLFELVKQYQTTNRQLYPDTFKLLES